MTFLSRSMILTSSWPLHASTKPNTRDIERLCRILLDAMPIAYFFRPKIFISKTLGWVYDANWAMVL